MRNYVGVIYLALIVLCAPGNSSIASGVRDNVRRTYLKEVGVREQGHNSGERVSQYLRAANAKPGAPWCVSFVSWVLTQNNVPNPRTAWSPSYFSKQYVIWKKGVGKQPIPGDVFGLWFRNLGRVGHGGFIDEDVGRYWLTVEGNTNAAGSREGDGVYRKRRDKRTVYAVSRFINE